MVRILSRAGAGQQTRFAGTRSATARAKVLLLTGIERLATWQLANARRSHEHAPL
jgi:hypothetical protein